MHPICHRCINSVAGCINSVIDASIPIDLLPIDLVKNDEMMTQLLTKIINSSFATGVFPAKLKHAIITPVLKKIGLDNQQLANFRPISNLSFTSKLIERVASRWLEQVLDRSKWLHQFQSAYRKGHSTETALLRVTSDWRQFLDSGKSVCVVSLDITAAFDTVNHALLLRKLSSAGVCGNALHWFSTYLVGRTMAGS
jgi:hypothetical protein